MENKKLALKKIANIKTGFQGKKDNDGNDYKLIKLGDVSEDGRLDLSDLESANIKDLKEKYLLKNNEILFKARSSQNTAALFKGEEDNLVANAHFFIISIKDRFRDKIIAQYLNWYLNESRAQQYFNKIGVGMAMPTIRKSDLSALKVIIPPVEKQNVLAETYNLFLEEKKLLNDYIKKREKQIRSILKKSI